VSQPGAEVQLTVAGASKAVASARTDAAGKAVIPLPEAAGARYVVKVGYSGLTYSSREIARPEAGGLRATYVVHDRTTDRSKLLLAPGTHWVCQIGERVVRFMQVLRLATKEELIVDPGQRPGLALPLPEGAEGVELPKALQGIVALDPQHPDKVWLRAPVPPMGLTIQIYYSLRYSGPSCDFRQRLPLALPKSVLRVLDNTEVRLAGPSIGGPAEDPERGQLLLLEPAGAGQDVVFSFTNLPHRDTRLRQLALLVVGLILVWGLIAALGGPRRARALARRREQLLDRLLRARSGKKRGKRKRGQRPGPEQGLRAELEQIWEEPW
jgi:hypothetical protein